MTILGCALLHTSSSAHGRHLPMVLARLTWKKCFGASNRVTPSSALAALPNAKSVADQPRIAAVLPVVVASIAVQELRVKVLSCKNLDRWSLPESETS